MILSPGANWSHIDFSFHGGSFPRGSPGEKRGMRLPNLEVCFTCTMGVQGRGPDGNSTNMPGGKLGWDGVVERSPANRTQSLFMTVSIGYKLFFSSTCSSLPNFRRIRNRG